MMYPKSIIVLSRNMKNIRFFFSENFPFWVVKFSIYMNRHDFIMCPNLEIDVHFKTSGVKNRHAIVIPKTYTKHQQEK